MTDELDIGKNIPDAIPPSPEIPRAEILLEKGKIIDLPPRALVLISCPEEIVDDVRSVFKKAIDALDRRDVVVMVVPDSIAVRTFATLT